jgi:hypothetical protein
MRQPQASFHIGTVLSVLKRDPAFSPHGTEGQDDLVEFATGVRPNGNMVAREKAIADCKAYLLGQPDELSKKLRQLADLELDVPTYHRDIIDISTNYGGYKVLIRAKSARSAPHP